ncbi:efflux RND transporter periplasmic adaptor subunit [Alteromonas sp. KUL49]|uniref:efflux RND transporter periplasmic adaptor subunit n=1 Tax=Alteromonas sp. KUL49 TaxID=2480798 RepID=UPI00102F1774|nr:efflux RND transporter periplasmic adaptor subunit [Alteromonas sp. KUL49]TAP42378.1 efflux RND transporter periplasmic adaptor subunit [Alteromonas sp. KUL49]GEA09995.1 RND transporter MFP subunit [Alteromonas sp. KUL49]
MIANTSGQDEQIVAKRSPWLKNGIIVFAIMTICIVFLWPSFTSWRDGVKQVDMSKVVTAEVVRGDLIRDIAVSGKLVAANAPQLYSTESGIVTLHVKPGDQVMLDDAVASIASPELTALLQQQRARITQMEIDTKRGLLADKETELALEGALGSALVALNAAKREKQRADLSFEKQVISQVEWAEAQDSLQEAQLLYSHAKDNVDLTRERLQFEQQIRANAVNAEKLVLAELERRQHALIIRSPVDGVVGNWLVAQKENVASSKALMTVVDLSQYEAELTVPEFYADELQVSLPVNITLSGQTINAQIASVSPEIENNQVVVRAQLIGTPTNLRLRQNQRLNARIAFESREDVLMVKRGAFLQFENGTQAYRLNDDGRVYKHPITTGVSSVEYVEITQGLAAGDHIIVSAYDEFNQADVLQLTQ